MKKVINLLNSGLAYKLMYAFIWCSSLATASECFSNGYTVTSHCSYQVVELEANADNEKNILHVSDNVLFGAALNISLKIFFITI